MTPAFTIGVDFGTNSVRAVVIDCRDGRAIGTHIHQYRAGEQGVLLDARDPHLARQDPADYLEGLRESVKGALAAAEAAGAGLHPGQRDRHRRRHHRLDAAPGRCLESAPGARSEVEVEPRGARVALEGSHLGGRGRRDHRDRRRARAGAARADRRDVFLRVVLVEDLALPARRAGRVRRGGELGGAGRFRARRCSPASPTRATSSAASARRDTRRCTPRRGAACRRRRSSRRLDPKLADLRDRLYERAYAADTPAGKLSTAWAETFGLTEGIAIAIGEFDAHYGAIGSGVTTGTFVKIIGTSTCDCVVSPMEKKLPDIPGICGIVPGSILPGYYGLEAGQSAVGDLLKWWVDASCDGQDVLHLALTEEAAQLRPGESGLLALDWNNGNRTVLVDPRLTGLLVGQTLRTSRAEIYRALIEATAFGARAIVERFEEYGVAIDRVVCCGGIAEKNRLFMQIYADVLGRPMLVAGSPQAPALGAAIGAAVVAGAAAGGYANFEDAQRSMTSLKPGAFEPNPAAVKVYDELYAMYRELHDSFGGVAAAAAGDGDPAPGVATAVNLGTLMKRLLALRERVVSHAGDGRHGFRAMIAEALREMVCRANMALADTGLILGTFGNVSGIDRAAGVMAIKPSGVAYDCLDAACMVPVSIATGEVLDGCSFRPSSDTPTHLELYRAFPTCGGIVHTHSESATALAQARLPVRCMGTTHADYFRGDIPVTRPMREEEVTHAYEANTGLVIVEAFRTAGSRRRKCRRCSSRITARSRGDRIRSRRSRTRACWSSSRGWTSPCARSRRRPRRRRASWSTSTTTGSTARARITVRSRPERPGHV